MLWQMLLLFGAYAVAQAVPSLEQIQSQVELDKAVAILDASFFNAYNQCDSQKYSAFLADDLEFYHDKTGLAVGKGVFLKAIKENICGKVQRELTAGSLEVHPLNGFGAVEIGSHRFCIRGLRRMGWGRPSL